tara:strand:+ start:827 stop:1456 length:630 start_codon:yes stop_codon:yes gene_type:complete
MKITKKQLKQIIKEELESPDDIIARYPDPEGKNPDQVIYRGQQDEFDHREKVLKSIQAIDFLKGRAQGYHADPPEGGAGTIKALLQDDFMDSPYPKWFGMHEGEPSIAKWIGWFAVGQKLNEVKKMKITKAQLKQIIKEELSEAAGAQSAMYSPDKSWPVGTDDILIEVQQLAEVLFDHPKVRTDAFNELKDINDILLKFIAETFVSGA